MSTAADLVLDTARRGELHHAVILHGPSPEPLRALALRIAQTLNCLNGSTGDDCPACSRIERRLHPDVHFIEVAGDRKMISIDQIREILEGAALRPYEGRTKVFIIDPADALSPSGSNSLLKTLEEPARDTNFILLTRSPDLLLPTIKSRSQPIHVGDPRRGRTRLEQIMENRELAKEIAALLERFATRRDGTALLAVGAIVGGHDDVKDAMALLAAILSAGDEKLDSVPREKLLAAAGELMAGIDALRVNADARLLVEKALAKLVA